MKSILLVNSSRYESSVDDIPSRYKDKNLQKVLSTNRPELGPSTVQLMDKADCVFSSPSLVQNRIS